jgi:hypothetical protein
MKKKCTNDNQKKNGLEIWKVPWFIWHDKVTYFINNNGFVERKILIYFARKPLSMPKTLTQLHKTQLFQHHTKKQQTSIERMPSTQH